jgi:hypothetical protein
VYLDLREGRRIASVNVPQLPDIAYLTISRDGATVVVLRQFEAYEGHVSQNYNVSVWKPYANPEKLQDYDFGPGPVRPGEQRQPGFCSFGSSPPVISPDGTHVAAFGHMFTGHEEGPEDYCDNAIGVLDLETGKFTGMLLPIQTPVGPEQFFSLGWSSDGRSVHVVVHGYWSDERKGPFVAGKPVLLVRRPDLTLYRFSLATKSLTRVGLVPPTTIGIGPDDDLIVADTVREGWGPHKAYARLPIADVEKQPLAGGAAALAFAAGLTMETVVGDNDPAFESFRHVFVGHAHTYAEVYKRGAKGCTALVERIPGAQPAK